MQIKLANPRGFCAGVDRAIEIVNRALEVFGPPIYVRHEVVHNKFVVEDLRARGAVFVEELDQVPDNVIVIFSGSDTSKLDEVFAPLPVWMAAENGMYVRPPSMRGQTGRSTVSVEHRL